MKQRKKIGLALGSGAARGMAHIGVLKVFEEENIPIDYISGTSFGAIIGALYASGVSVAQLEEVGKGVNWARLARLVDPIFSTSGLIDGRKLSVFLEDLLPRKNFEDLDIPLALTATDVESGEAIVIRRGNLLEALRAAVSFPGVFTPVAFGDRFLIDGGITNPIPIDVVRELGAEFAIGVCTLQQVDKRSKETFLPVEKEKSEKSHFKEWLTPLGLEEKFKKQWPFADRKEGDERRPPNIFRIFAQSVVIMENQIASLQLQQNHIDVLIRPPLGNMTLLEFNKSSDAIQSGENTARNHIEEVRSLAGLD
ncbi:MAG: patatin-like phospholipase family protein [Desulfuromonadales bacterium]